jgi:hypothetical protein
MEPEGEESSSVRICCLCLVVEDGLDAALMPVKMTTHRLHTSYGVTFSKCLFRLPERSLRQI